MTTTPTKTRSAKSLANEFIALAERDKKPLTNMQLQKLVYIAHGFCLGILSHPLIDNHVYAWPFGPVIKPLYESLRKYGNGVVTEKIPETGEFEATSDEREIIDGVWESYGSMTGPKLSGITHQPGTPWSRTWKLLKFGVIPDLWIRAYYKERLKSRQTG